MKLNDFLLRCVDECLEIEVRDNWTEKGIDGDHAVNGFALDLAAMLNDELLRSNVEYVNVIDGVLVVTVS